MFVLCCNTVKEQHNFFHFGCPISLGYQTGNSSTTFPGSEFTEVELDVGRFARIYFAPTCHSDSFRTACKMFKFLCDRALFIGKIIKSYWYWNEKSDAEMYEIPQSNIKRYK